MKMLTRESTIDTWTKLLPNVKDTEQLEQYIKEYWGYTLEEVLDDYDSESDSQIDFIEKIVTENTAAEYNTAYDVLYSAVSDKYAWNEFFRPILRNAGDQIIDLIGSSNIIEEKENVCKETIDALYAQCYDIAFRVIFQEYSYAKKEGKLTGENDDENYLLFNEMLKDPEVITSIYNSYPELIRLLEVRCRWFVNATRELICGTEKEIENIRENIDNNVRTINSISFSEGDSHREGRMVCIIKFNDDIKVVYKPRTLETEDAFNSIINYFNEIGKNKDFRALNLFKYYTNKKQGWTEFINYEPCDNEGEVRDYYKKMGELLCILYMLNAKDFHSENIICRKSDPILIDLETLLHSAVFEGGIALEGAYSTAVDIINRSVMKIGFLPTKIVNSKNNKRLEVGAMGRQREQESPFVSITAVRDENGNLKLEKTFGKLGSHSCCPILNGEIQDAVKYIEEVMDGFELTYKLVCENKKQFADFVVSVFSSKLNRLIVRSTNIYDQLVRTSYHPLLLRNTWDRKMFLLKIVAASDTDTFGKGLLHSELNDMYNGDIPYFTSISEENELINSNGCYTKQTFDKSLLDGTVETILGMNDVDMKRQLGFINLSFADDLEEEGMTTETLLIKRNIFPEDIKDKKISKEEFLDRILQITEEKAVKSTDNAVDNLVWLNINRSPVWPTYISFMKPDIYCGLSGQYMYLNNYGRLTGNKKALEMAGKIEKNLRSHIEDFIVRKDFDFGGFVGLSGAVYAFAREGMDKAELTKLFNVMVDGIDVAKSQQTDLLAGIAGIAKTIIYTYKKLDDFSGFRNEDREKAKKKLREIADELMTRAIYENENALYWGEEGYTGYAHGVAGIIDALADYYDFSKDERVVPFIEKGYRFIESCFVKDMNNWARTKERGAVSINWCHGAPGITLMKMRLAEVFGDRFVTRSDLEEIGNIIMTNGFGIDHCLCHGDMGNLMILKRLAETLGNEEMKNFCIDQFYKSLDGLKEKVFGDYFYYSEDTAFMVGPQTIAIGILDIAYNGNMVDILTLR